MQCPDCEGHGHYHPFVALERGGDGTCAACGGTGVLGGVPAEPVSALALEEDVPAEPVSAPAHEEVATDEASDEEPVDDDAPPVDDDTQ